MALALNGTTGYLEFAGKVVGSFPCSMSVWVSCADSGNSPWAMAQGQSDFDRRITFLIASNGNPTLELRNPGNSASVDRNTPPLPDTTMRLAVMVYNSASSRDIYFGSTTAGHDSAAMLDDISNHDRVVVGAYHFNSSAPALFLSGKVAEPHFYNTALTPTQITALLNDTVKPEATAGWVDGWTLKNLDPSGNYVSIGGTRTLTAVGGVTDAGMHPITRAAPTQTMTGANCTQANTSGTGTITQVTPPPGVNLIGATCTQVNTSSTGVITQTGGTLGTLTSRPACRNSHNGLVSQLWASEANATVHVYSLTTGNKITTKTGVNLNSAGVWSISDALFVAGTSYDTRTVLAGGARGSDILGAV